MSANCDGVGIGVDRAVAVDEHAVGQAHEEHRRGDRHLRHRLDDLECGPDGVRGRVSRAGHHRVGEPTGDHHRAEVVHVAHHVVGHVERHALVRAQLGVRGRELVPPRRGGGVDDVGRRHVQAQLPRAAGHLVGRAEQRQVGDPAAQQHLGRPQDPLLRTLGQHHAAPVGPGPVDQRVLEHQRRHPRRSSRRPAAASARRRPRWTRTRRLRPRPCAGCRRRQAGPPDQPARRPSRSCPGCTSTTGRSVRNRPTRSSTRRIRPLAEGQHERRRRTAAPAACAANVAVIRSARSPGVITTQPSRGGRGRPAPAPPRPRNAARRGRTPRRRPAGARRRGRRRPRPAWAR